MRFHLFDEEESSSDKNKFEEETTSSVDKAMSASSAKCASNQFQCRAGECVLSAYVCDGHRDCGNGRDERDCNARELDKYLKRGRSRLDTPYLERWLDSTVRACAIHCKNARGFICRSFNYHAGKRLCTLAEDNVGTTGKLIEDRQWDHYELRTEQISCNETLRCPNGKCLNPNQLCDGKDDCGDKFDEHNCRTEPNLKIRLAGGRTPNEGRIEIKAFHYGYGGICDDGFSIEEANVVCKQLGFSLGAKEAAINSRFGSGEDMPILLDELDCDGSENDILGCRFDPWTKNDCSKKEWAGVVCKTEAAECHRDEVMKDIKVYNTYL